MTSEVGGPVGPLALRPSSASSERRPAARAPSWCSRSTKYSTAEMAAIPSVTKSHDTAASYERPFIEAGAPRAPCGTTRRQSLPPGWRRHGTRRVPACLKERVFVNTALLEEEHDQG